MTQMCELNVKSAPTFLTNNDTSPLATDFGLRRLVTVDTTGLEITELIRKMKQFDNIFQM